MTLESNKNTYKTKTKKKNKKKLRVLMGAVAWTSELAGIYVEIKKEAIHKRY